LKYVIDTLYIKNVVFYISDWVELSDTETRFKIINGAIISNYSIVINFINSSYKTVCYFENMDDIYEYIEDNPVFFRHLHKLPTN